MARLGWARVGDNWQADFDRQTRTSQLPDTGGPKLAGPQIRGLFQSGGLVGSRVMSAICLVCLCVRPRAAHQPRLVKTGPAFFHLGCKK